MFLAGFKIHEKDMYFANITFQKNLNLLGKCYQFTTSKFSILNPRTLQDYYIKLFTYRNECEDDSGKCEASECRNTAGSYK